MGAVPKKKKKKVDVKPQVLMTFFFNKLKSERQTEIYNLNLQNEEVVASER